MKLYTTLKLFQRKSNKKKERKQNREEEAVNKILCIQLLQLKFMVASKSSTFYTYSIALGQFKSEGMEVSVIHMGVYFMVFHRIV